MTRTYKLYKISTSAKKEKLVKEFPNMQEATLKVRSILGLREFQRCVYILIFEGNAQMGMNFYKDGDKIFVIRKEIAWDGQNN